MQRIIGCVAVLALTACGSDDDGESGMPPCEGQSITMEWTAMDKNDCGITALLPTSAALDSEYRLVNDTRCDFMGAHLYREGGECSLLNSLQSVVCHTTYGKDLSFSFPSIGQLDDPQGGTDSLSAFVVGECQATFNLRVRIEP